MLTLRSAARRYEADVDWDYMMANLAPVTGGQLYRLASQRDESSEGRTADNSLSMDFATGDLHEEGLVIPFGKGVTLPRNSTEGDSSSNSARLLGSSMETVFTATSRPASLHSSHARSDQEE